MKYRLWSLYVYLMHYPVLCKIHVEFALYEAKVSVCFVVYFQAVKLQPVIIFIDELGNYRQNDFGKFQCNINPYKNISVM